MSWGGTQTTGMAWATPSAEGGLGGLKTAFDVRSFHRSISPSFEGVQALES